MKYDPAIHHRRSIRLPRFDYSSPGAYFVTICAQERRCFFGEIVDGHSHLNDAGTTISGWWSRIGAKFGVQPDLFVVMPNHFHGIVLIPTNDVGADPRVRPTAAGPLPTTGRPPATPASTQGAQAAPLPQIMQWFKTMTTNEYIRGVRQRGWPPFPGRLWQRNYYERVIRDDAELNRARQYIIDNPLKWGLDPLNPRST